MDDEGGDAEVITGFYDAMYSDFNDAIAIIGADVAAALKRGGEEAANEVNELEFVQAYMTFLRLEKTMERTLRWIVDKQNEMKVGGGGKPEDLIRL
jgi:hypothetical protein